MQGKRNIYVKSWGPRKELEKSDFIECEHDLKRRVSGAKEKFFLYHVAWCAVKGIKLNIDFWKGMIMLLKL